MSKLVLIGSAALVLALAAPASAQERAGAGKTLIYCDGFVQEQVITNTENGGPFALSGVGVIPNTNVPGGASGAGTDLYTVTFSAETRHTSGGRLSVRAQVSVNGGPFVSINPLGPNIFHTGAQTETHTMTWCTQLEATTNADFRIVYSEAAGGGVGVVDDYTTRVERSD